VPFTLLPAIDLTEGRLGTYAADGPVPVDAFGGDAVLAARAFVDDGARWLHVVDMDLAFGGAVRNAAVVTAIAEACPGAQIQASGQIRSFEEASAYLAAGAARVVVGSAALVDEDAATRLVGRLGPAAIVGIEVDGGRIRSRGADPVDLDLMATVGWLAALAVPGFLVTAVARVGGLAGPDTATVRRVARSGRPTLAAGGIRSVQDLAAVREAGALGAVVGRATLEGALDLSDALAWAAA
jgi:phosphoribosylformimino-5-aminoimidazole carboxamide ribonucleotide (ProFAR) isomerase